MNLNPQQKKELRFVLISALEVIIGLSIALVVIYLIFKK
jgi:hypothetical protein